MKTAMFFALTLTWGATAPAWAVEGQKVIKIAIVAPKGSVWHRTQHQMTSRLYKETKGKVKFIWYPGMVQGDERDVVRKLRTGQLQGAAFSFTGLSLITPKVVVLQMPGIFTTHEQVEKVRTALHEEFDKAFLDKGYVNLGWSDVGFFYLFSKNPVKTLADLRKQKLGVWADDQATKALARELGESPRLLSLPQFYAALSTGMIDALIVSPVTLITMQWQSFVKHATAQPLYYAVGATVITKKAYDALSPEEQQLLRKLASKYYPLVRRRVKRSNQKALDALKAHGLKVTPFDDKSWKQIKKAGDRVIKSFSPRYFPKELLDKVLKAR